MADMDKALATQLANIEKRTGKSIDELIGLVKASGLEKHGQMVAMLKGDLGMGHGDANTVVHLARKADEAEPGPADALDGLYTGPKADLRSLHDRLLAAMADFGDFEAAPKKSYVSYRRSRQFAMIGPATKTQVEIGLNVKELPASDRLKVQPPGRMCQYTVRIGDPAEVDEELVGFVKAAYDAAG